METVGRLAEDRLPSVGARCDSPLGGQVPEDRLQGNATGRDMERCNRLVVGEGAVDVQVGQRVEVVGPRRIAEVLPTQEPGGRCLVALQAIGIGLRLAMAVGDDDGVADEEPQLGAEQLQGRAAAVDQPGDLEGTLVAGKGKQREARVGDRRVEDGVEVVDEGLSRATRRARSGQCEEVRLAR